MNRQIAALLSVLAAAAGVVLWLASSAAALDPWDEGPHTEPGPRTLTAPADTNRQGA